MAEMHAQRSSVVRRGLTYAIYPAMTLSGIGFGLWACAVGWPIWLTGSWQQALGPFRRPRPR